MLCERHKALLEEFWKLAIELGRMPAPEEFARHSERIEAIGSAKRGMTLLELLKPDPETGESRWSASRPCRPSAS